MLKKVALAAVFLVTVFGLGYLFPRQRTMQPPVVLENVDPKNCTYVIDGKEVVLRDGYSERAAAPGSAAKVVTRYFGNGITNDFNGDEFADTAFLLTQNSGGSGTFYYVAVALGGYTGCTGTNAVFLGDRIAPQATESRDGQIVVNFAERKPGEPMVATPSVGISKYFTVRGYTLAEIPKKP